MDKKGSNHGDKKGVGNGRIGLWGDIIGYQDLVQGTHPSYISLYFVRRNKYQTHKTSLLGEIKLCQSIVLKI